MTQNIRQQKKAGYYIRTPSRDLQFCRKYKPQDSQYKEDLKLKSAVNNNNNNNNTPGFNFLYTVSVFIGFNYCSSR